MTDKASNAKVSLEQVLSAREQRARRQQAWLFQSEQTVVSVTLVWPGGGEGYRSGQMGDGRRGSGARRGIPRASVDGLSTSDPAAVHGPRSALVGVGTGVDDQTRHGASGR